MSKRLLVLGDVHGAARALDQVLRRAEYAPGSDRLVFLGDVCDGWPDVRECMERLHMVGAERVWGNHDVWADEWTRTGLAQPAWLSQGGRATFDDFDGDALAAREVCGPYFAECRDYIYDEDRDYLFVHAGIPRDRTVHTLPGRQSLTWDRSLFEDAALAYLTGDPSKPLTRFTKVFIGHTTTERFSDTPVEAGGVVLLDQGGGWTGKLSLMDADTGEYWQSDVVTKLYPNVRGRQAA